MFGRLSTFGIIIYGRKGGGKSTYAIKTVATYYMRREGLECGDAYQKALSTIAFSARDLLNRIDEDREIVIWDDAGLWGSTYMWFDSAMRPYLEALLDWYDVARTDVNVLIMTTPTKKKLPPKIRDDADAIIARVNKHGVVNYKERRIKTAVLVAARNHESLYSDKMFRSELFRDHFRVWLPDPVYEYYRIIRKEYSKYAKRKLAKILQIMEQIGEDIRVRILKKRLGLEDEYT